MIDRAGAKRLVDLGLPILWLCGPDCDGDSHGGHSPDKAGKIPLTAGWSDAPCPRGARGLLGYRDGANAAIRTGVVEGAAVQVVVVDTDDESVELAVAATLPATPWMVRTRRGWHRYYLCPAGGAVKRPWKVALLDGTVGTCDVQGNGGYVVGPGSVHASGVEYTPTRQWSSKDVGKIPTFDPAWFPLESGGPVVRPGTDPSQARRWTVAELIEAALRAEEFLTATDTPVSRSGHRGDDTAYDVALALVRGFPLADLKGRIFDEIADGAETHGLVDAEREAVAVRLLEVNWNPRCVDSDGVTPFPWPTHLLARKVREALRGHLGGKPSWWLFDDAAVQARWRADHAPELAQLADLLCSTAAQSGSGAAVGTGGVAGLGGEVGGGGEGSGAGVDAGTSTSQNVGVGTQVSHSTAHIENAFAGLAGGPTGRGGTDPLPGARSQRGEPPMRDSGPSVPGPLDALPELLPEDERLAKIQVTHDTESMKAQVLHAMSSMDLVYVKDCHLVDIVLESGRDRHGESRRPWVRPTGFAHLKCQLNSLVYWYTVSGRGGEEARDVRVRADSETVKAVLAAGHYPEIPRLEGMVFTPVLRRDGSILQKPGYDSQTGLYYHSEVECGEIRDNPTPEQCTAARDYLLEVISDYPFLPGKESQCKSVWLSAVLTRFCRYAYSGLAPMFVVSAAEASSGKGKLVDSVCMIADGRPADCVAFTGDVDEDNRLILSKLAEGAHAVSLDNIPVGLPLASSAYEMMLTAHSFSGREIGTSRNKRIVFGDTLWFATGNHLQVSGDMPRRILRIDILDRSGAPGQRAVKRPDLIGFCRDNRARLVRAALTLLSGWVAAGRPRAKLPTFPSYEQWSEIVRQCVVWCGLPDPCDAVGSAAGNADNTTLAHIIDHWRTLFPDGEYVSRACAAMRLDVKRFSTLMSFLTDNGLEKITPVGLGRFLTTRGSKGVYTDAEGAKWRLVNRQDKQGSFWRVVQA